MKHQHYHLGLMALILIALAVRLHHLTYHSLWFDEAVSVYWARQSVPRILEVGFALEEDRLPPLFYLTLKGWAGLVGFGEFAIRSLPAFYGVLLLPVLADLGRRLFNRRVGLMVAALVAVNPFLVWYAQEVRMYAPAVFFSALAVWAWLRVATGHSSLVTRHSSLPLRFTFYVLLFVISAIAALYSHLYAGFLLPALGLWTLIAYPRRWRLWLLFGASGLVITLAYAPILLAIWRFSGESTPGEPLAGLGGRAWWLLHSFTVWKAPLPAWLQVAVPLTVLLFVLFAFLPPYAQFAIRNAQLLVTLLLLTPFAIATLLLARNHLAFFGERYFIVMTPWLLLLAAVGADKLGHWSLVIGHSSLVTRHSSLVTRHSSLVIRHSSFVTRHSSLALAWGPAIILFILTALPLPGQWSAAAAKEAWRQSVAYLANHATPADGILIHPDWVRYPFQYYFQGPGQTYAAFSTVTAETPLDGPLQGVVGNHSVIWLIQSHIETPDPDRRVEQWLAARYPLVTELYPPGISLKGFAPGYQLEALPPTATPTEGIRFDNGLRLAGVSAANSAAATDALFHPPSGWLHVTLYWQADRPLSETIEPFVHLVGPEGVWGVSLTRSNDALNLLPPTRWPPGLIVRQDVDVNLNPATPPGEYQLLVGLEGAAQQFSLGAVEVR